MTDAQFIDHMAEEWIQFGGDADGFSFCMFKILEAIKQKEDV